MSKYCKDCWALNKNPLYKYCRKHIWGHQKPKKKYELKRTPVNKVSNKKKKRLQEWKSEKKKFIEIAIKRAINWEVKCQKCSKSIKLINLTHWNFDHRIPKSKWEDYRLDENNIDILCVACHFEKTNWQKLKVKYNN